MHVKDYCITESGVRGSNSGGTGGSSLQRGNTHDDDTAPAFSPTLEMPTSGTYRPSAPQIEHKDIDKPPAYDALFPSQPANNHS